MSIGSAQPDIVRAAIINLLSAETRSHWQVTFSLRQGLLTATHHGFQGFKAPHNQEATRPPAT